MFDRKEFRESWRKMMTGWTEKELDEYTDFMEQKYSTIKHGENVVHLEYYGGLIDNTDINTIENLLSKSNLELSRFDKNGVPYAALEDFMLQVSLFVNDSTTREILLGLGTNALWDTIKTVTLLVWQKVRNQTSLPINKHKKINCGISMTIDKNTKFDFKISSEFSDETTLEALDKALEFLKTVTPNETRKRQDFVVYDKYKNKWEVIDTDAEIRKLILAQKEKEDLSKNKKGRS